MTPNGFPRSRLLLALAIAIPLGVLGDALWVRADPTGPPWQPLDDFWNGLVGGPDSGLLWRIAAGFDAFGGRAGLVVLVVGVVLLLALRRWRSAVYACAAVASASLIVDGIKEVAQRPRPADIMIETASWAFPSGHSARMAAFVVVIAVVAVPARHLRYWWPVAAALTLAMMLARNWQHAHWLTDTVGGAATGWAVATFLWWACAPLLERERALLAGVVHEASSGAGADRLS